MTNKVCISGYYGFDNFGDETILKVLIENLKKFTNPPQITVFSANPEKTSLKTGVSCVHSFNLYEIIKNLVFCDCLISGGGSLLQDATSLKSLIYYLFVIMSALFFRKKVIIFAQGIGPINNKFFANLTFFLLRKTTFVSVRDEKSLNLLKKYKINAIKCADPVWNFNCKKSLKSGKIGIQLRKCDFINNLYIKKLAVCINKYYQGKEINILSLQNDIDLEVCNKLKEYLNKINPKLTVEIIENTSEDKVIKDICNLEELIAMRYHACLIAIKAGVKLLPIAYDIKVKTLSEEFNLVYLNKYNEQTESIFEEYINKKTEYNELKIKNLKFDFNLIEELI